MVESRFVAVVADFAAIVAEIVVVGVNWAACPEDLA